MWWALDYVLSPFVDLALKLLNAWLAGRDGITRLARFVVAWFWHSQSGLTETCWSWEWSDGYWFCLLKAVLVPWSTWIVLALGMLLLTVVSLALMLLAAWTLRYLVRAWLFRLRRVRDQAIAAQIQGLEVAHDDGEYHVAPGEHPEPIDPEESVRVSGPFWRWLTNKIRNEFAVPVMKFEDGRASYRMLNDSPAQRAAARKFGNRLAETWGVRAEHIANNLDQCVEIAFTPSKAQVEAAQVPASSLATLRRVELAAPLVPTTLRGLAALTVDNGAGVSFTTGG